MKVIKFDKLELERGIFVTYPKLVEKYGIQKNGNLRVPGSMVCEICYAASGAAIGTIAHANIWDLAAGLAIAKNTGVNMYDLKTKEMKKELFIDDFEFSDTKSWKLKENLLVSSESAKDYIFDNIIR